MRGSGGRVGGGGGGGGQWQWCLLLRPMTGRTPLAGLLPRRYSSGTSMANRPPPPPPAPTPLSVASLFIPAVNKESSSEEDSVASHQLLVRAGFIRQCSRGVYSLLPLGVRTLQKIENIIDEEMATVGGQKVRLPLLLPATLWKATGRWEQAGPEMFRLKDRKGTDYCLAPTHEELITELCGKEVSSYRQLPLRLYQIGAKYRDEKRPRFGLLRGREFLMKDMYSFDATKQEALRSYGLVLEAYKRVMHRLGLNYTVAAADGGNIGGDLTHEFHVWSDIGEDTLLFCERCGYVENSEMIEKRKQKAQERAENASSSEPEDRAQEDEKKEERKAQEATHSTWMTINDRDSCSRSDCPKTLIERTGIEIGHVFYLGTKYSQALGANVTGADGVSRAMEMGCYGLGITRILAAIAQTNHDENGLKWPASVAPYKVAILSMANAKESSSPLLHEMATQLWHTVNQASDFKGEVLLDDRDYETPGSKMKQAQLLGLPCTVIVGKAYKNNGQVEVEVRRTGQRRLLQPSQLVPFLREVCSV
ncbi:prolyl-tRNA synthetase [Balamuthia mandrillaris]